MSKTTSAPGGAQREGSRADRVRDYARQTTGSEAFYRHWTGELIYTDGIRYMAEECGAWWLVDLIASWQTKPRVGGEQFQLWLLSAPESATKHWVASCWTDTPGEGRRVARQAIEYLFRWGLGEDHVAADLFERAGAEGVRGFAVESPERLHGSLDGGLLAGRVAVLDVVGDDSLGKVVGK